MPEVVPGNRTRPQYHTRYTRVHSRLETGRATVAGPSRRFFSRAHPFERRDRRVRLRRFFGGARLIRRLDSKEGFHGTRD